MKRFKQTSFYVSEETLAAIRALSVHAKIPLAGLVRMGIDRVLEKHADLLSAPDDADPIALAIRAAGVDP